MKLTIKCPECINEIEVDYVPPDGGRTHGPPEKCYPPSGDEHNLDDECPHCGEKFQDTDAMVKEAFEDWRDWMREATCG